MYGITYQLIVYMLVVLIMFKNKIDKYLVKSVLNLQMTYIIIAHIYEQWDR